EPMALIAVTDPAGKVLERHVPEGAQVISPQTAYLITNMMEDVIQQGTGKGAKVLGRPLAGKTGTTNDFTDAWFVGFAPNIATGVWVGFDAIQPIGDHETGARAALPIWTRYMGEALNKLPTVPFTIPEEIAFVKIDPDTGLLAPPTAVDFAVEVFRKGTEPTEIAAGGGIPRHRPARFIDEEDPVD
ncbi:MAG: penicillin-binding protein, partial [Nitrospirae bacterium]|nr:penicillin-binding protein [Nitrospirota bacterium]